MTTTPCGCEQGRCCGFHPCCPIPSVYQAHGTECTPARCTCTPVDVRTLNVWHTASSGRARVRLFANTSNQLEVYALDGHELLPRTRSFPLTSQGFNQARAYANTLWGSL